MALKMRTLFAYMLLLAMSVVLGRLLASMQRGVPPTATGGSAFGRTLRPPTPARPPPPSADAGNDVPEPPTTTLSPRKAAVATAKPTTATVAPATPTGMQQPTLAAGETAMASAMPGPKAAAKPKGKATKLSKKGEPKRRATKESHKGKTHGRATKESQQGEPERRAAKEN